MAILIDTNFILAIASPKDSNNAAAKKFLPLIRKEELIVSASVLGELFYMVTSRLNYDQAIQTFALVRQAFKIHDLTEPDMVRMQQIMTQYRSAEFDFVDVSIIVLAERLNIQKICTFDRRDFSIFKPTHCAYLELLPT